MNFPRHWMLAKRGEVSAWGWSDESPVQAQARAESRLERIIAWLASGKEAQAQRYGYPDRPMREEVLKEFRDSEGTLAAAVTRNSYGCLVLNTAGLMFVDVDAPEKSCITAVGGFLTRLFGLGKSANVKPLSFELELQERVQRWLEQKPGWGWRVYQTRAGVRLVATHGLISPGDEACSEAFEFFSADPLYRQLCKTQNCFRARLTPKPWRCGADKPPHRWPWRDARAESAFKTWDRAYLSRANNHATCELLGHFGRLDVHPSLDTLIEFHDTATRAMSKLPLA